MGETKLLNKDLGLRDLEVNDEALLAAMLVHPILVNRSIATRQKAFPREDRMWSCLICWIDRRHDCFTKQTNQ